MRLAQAVILALALAGCAPNASGVYLGGIGDPVRGAALSAPQVLGDTSRWAGRPAEAAAAAAQLEFLADALRTDPRYAPEINPAVTHQLDAARAEMRAALGIAPEAPPTLVIQALRRAAASLQEGSAPRAEVALAGPAFTAGPPATLARLGALPRLPQTAAAAGAVASEFSRLDPPARR